MLFFNANFICYYFYPTKKREEPKFSASRLTSQFSSFKSVFFSRHLDTQFSNLFLSLNTKTRFSIKVENLVWLYPSIQSEGRSMNFRSEV